MRILHFISSLDTNVGGPARAVLDLSAALAARGLHVTIATADAGEAPWAWTSPTPGMPHLRKLQAPALPGFMFSPRQIAPLHALIAAHDIVHLHGVWEPANLQFASVARSHAVPYVVSTRGMLARWSMQQRPIKKRIYLDLLGRRWLAHAAQLHFTAEAERKDALPWIRRRHGMVVIPNVLDLSCFRETTQAAAHWPALEDSRASRFTILFLSRIHPKKGLDVLIQAFALLKRDVADVRLVVAGDGDAQYLASMHALTTSLALTSQDVLFVGAVSGQKKLALYRACDLLALPTQQENFGFVFIEALASGLPIVTTAVDLHDELQRSGCVTISARTANDFYLAIRKVYDERHTLKQLGTRARSWVLETFATDRIAARFESMYSSVLAERPGFVRGRFARGARRL